MSSHPNILLVISDEQRTDTLGFMGRTPCKTPNMDRLAREGISFDRAICPNPLCLPSRASMFSGQYSHQVDMMGNADTIQAEPYLTDRLRAAGYHTAYAGKWHLEPEEMPKRLVGREEELGLSQFGELAPKGQRKINRWFECAAGQSAYDYTEWCEDNGLPDGWAYSDDDLRSHRVPSAAIPRVKRETRITADQTFDAWVTDHALRLLDERPADQPFFLVCGLWGPHPPFAVPDPYFDMYDAAAIPEPANFHAAEGKPASVGRSFHHKMWKDHGETWDDWRKSMAVYWGFISMVDYHLGRLIGRLERDGILDDTLVIFCSDHGEMLGSHMLWQKTAPYEECLRVPLIMRLPKRIGGGLRNTSAASLIDIPSTILSVANCKIPGVYQGRDLSSAFNDGRDPQADPYRFSETRSLGDWHGICDFRLVVDERYKFIWHDGDCAELYDLAEDPFELKNLAEASSKSDVRDRLSGRLAGWMEETSDPLRARYDG